MLTRGWRRGAPPCAELALSTCAPAGIAPFLEPAASWNDHSSVEGPAHSSPQATRCGRPWDHQQQQQRQQRRWFHSQLPGGAQQPLDLGWLGPWKSLVVDDASHKSLVQEAFRDRKLSFGFSGGGTLYPYYIGVVGALRDGGVLTEGVKVGGASAGSLIATVHQSGLDLSHVTEMCMRFMGELREQGTRGRLGAQLERFLRDHLPHDAHERCRDQAYVAVTQAYPYVRRLLVSHYHDRDDLISAIMASCHIPYYLDGRPYTVFRGVPCIDGGLTRFIPLAPQTVGVRVCCFPSRQLNPYYRIGISPDSFEAWPYTVAQMVQFAFNPADEKFVVDFIEKGKRDAQAWMEQMGLHPGGERDGGASRGESEVDSAKAAAVKEGEKEVEEKEAAAAA